MAPGIFALLAMPVVDRFAASESREDQDDHPHSPELGLQGLVLVAAEPLAFTSTASSGDVLPQQLGKFLHPTPSPPHNLRLPAWR